MMPQLRTRSPILPWLALAAGLAAAWTGLAQPSVLPVVPKGEGVPVLGPPPAGWAATAPALPLALPPVRLRVAAIGVDAVVVPVGVDPGGALAVPVDPAVVGWWSAGARPGATTGSVVLDGHVDTSADGPGALFHLADMRRGDTVVLETGAGSSRYVVGAVRRYRKDRLPAEVFDTAGPPRLVLISCGGSFDRQRRSYSDNVVVFAVPSGAAVPVSGPAPPPPAGS